MTDLERENEHLKATVEKLTRLLERWIEEYAGLTPIWKQKEELQEMERKRATVPVVGKRGKAKTL